MVAALAAAAALSACGAEDPTRVGRPPVVSGYSPGPRALTPQVGDTLSFSLSAFDPDGDALTTWFTVDGARVANESAWEYVIADTGIVTVRGSVRDGDGDAFIEWEVERVRPINLPPVIGATLPVESSPVLVVNNNLQFAIAANDPEARPLQFSYTVNDSVIANDPQVTYRPTSIGTKHVRVVVTDGENYAAHDWSLKVTSIPDTIAPAMVPIVSAVPGAEPGEIDLEWVAVGRDNMLGLASEYQVRTSPDPILTEADWERASRRPDAPAPVPPGTTMRMTAGGLLPARLTYITVRAVDDFGNHSPLAAPVRVASRGMRISGVVRDPLTGLPMESARVDLGAVLTAQTDAEGRFELRELEPITTVLATMDENGAGIGAYYDCRMGYTVVHEDELELFLLPVYDLETPNYIDFMQFYRSMTDMAANPEGTATRRFRLPIDLYIRPFSNSGLDYRATIERVAREFDDLLGTQVFNIVATRPETGVETVCREGVPQDNYAITEFTSDWYPRTGLIEFRTLYTPATEHVLARTARHEFGHVLGLNHSTDPNHIMVGGQAPSANALHPDELAVLRVRFNLPRGFEIRRFVRE